MIGRMYGLAIFSAAVLAAGAAFAQHFPEKIERSCRWGKAKVYDECGSQIELLQKAVAAARANRKIVLVHFGAEWCVWCHSFDQTIRGMAGRTTVYHLGDAYQMGELPASNPRYADDIRDYVKDTFVVVSIEGQYSPDGYDALAATGSRLGDSLPFVFTLKDGRFASAVRWNDALPGIEVQSDGASFYRGFDRKILLSELKRVAAAAR